MTMTGDAKMQQPLGGDGGKGPLRSVVHQRHHVSPPAHHVVQPSTSFGQQLRENVPLLPTLMPSQEENLYSTEKTSVFLNAGPSGSTTSSDAYDVSRNTVANANSANFVRLGFQNPWNSWHKPTLSEVWNGLYWGRVNGGADHQTEEAEKYRSAIEIARKRETSQPDDQDAFEDVNPDNKGTQTENVKDASSEDCQVEDDDLKLLQPDFTPSQNDRDMVRATWLGHATVLLQLPPLRIDADAEPIRVLFDPIFSLRCSPTQYVGPVRLYPAPCSVSALPRIDVVCISHSHYDHLDYDSIVELWRANADHLRFVVPLGNKSWFLGLGLQIDEDRVTELDWWDEVWMTDDASNVGVQAQAQHSSSTHRLRIVCTPAQHGSGRYGFDAGRSLWSSWCVERTPIDENAKHNQIFRAFFGGDTGFQFHSCSPHPTRYTTCPAFEEVHRVLGPPHLSFLPISVGATFNFVKSYDTFGLVPNLDDGLTGANHMTPFDAVRVARILAGYPDRYSYPVVDEQTHSIATDPPTQGQSGGVVMAIHWGTFASGIDEVRRSMRDLESACAVQNVRYVRSLDQRTQMARDAKSVADGAASSDDAVFACIDHGDALWIKL